MDLSALVRAPVKNILYQQFIFARPQKILVAQAKWGYGTSVFLLPCPQ
jgi:hypothetical protein